ncbi:MAG: hypothetical protein AABX83_00065 [Nanoarchaeota archaeon]
MADKWYDSKFGQFLGIGLALGSAYFGLGFMLKTNLDRRQTKYIIQEADINENGISDKFYLIDGKRAVVELDGKPLSGLLERKVLEK